MSSYQFSGAKLLPWSAVDVTLVRRLVVVVMCGSFNPIHKAHIASYDAVQNALTSCNKESNADVVVGGFISPVNDNYKKNGIIPFSQRAAICAVALADHPSLEVDEWEGLQSVYVRTYHVLDHLQTAVQRWYEEDACPSEAQLVWVRRHPVHVAFACGSDLFASFLHPGCWDVGLLKQLLDRFEVVVVQRGKIATSCKTILSKFDPLLHGSVEETESGQTTVITLDISAYQFREVEIFSNDISSSAIRELLAANPAADISSFVPAAAEAFIRTIYTRN